MTRPRGSDPVNGLGCGTVRCKQARVADNDQVVLAGRLQGWHLRQCQTRTRPWANRALTLSVEMGDPNHVSRRDDVLAEIVVGPAIERDLGPIQYRARQSN
ncbi:hypothetical protein G6F65_017939 [Rhizopus arrhizus]|nr:hypothetical protein G6F68_017536 [Rhizopus microsporus]KAG1252395.1 hypothetical protein G6F65_017939 [Rhizopus arrhizus]